MSSSVVNLALLAGCFLALVSATPNGAPPAACQSLIPQHSGAQPQRSLPPYEVDLDFDAVREGGAGWTVTLKSEILGQTFKGFIVQVVSVNSNKVIGRFQTPDSPPTKTLDCLAEDDSATHADSRDKREVQLAWFPPAQFDGRVKVLASVVKDHQTFWTNLESEPQTVGRPSDDSPNGAVLTRTTGWTLTLIMAVGLATGW